MRSVEQIYPLADKLTKTQQPLNVSTHQFINSTTPNSSTHKLTNSITYKLNKLINSQTQ